MKRITLLSLVSLFLVLFLVACGTPAPVEPGAAGTETPTAAVLDYEGLLAQLEAAGVNVEAAGLLEDPFFPVDAWTVMVEGAPVSVFQFADEAAAEAAAQTVNATGTIIGTTIVDWVEPPHFYRQGRLIALYAGEDEAVLAALSAQFGEPFVVGDGMFGPIDDGAAVLDYEGLLAALEAAGVNVEAAGILEDPFFPVDSWTIMVEGAPVSVFQFADEAAAEAAAGTVNPTGNIIGTISVDWVEPPHFYRQGRLIALYAGEDQAVQDALSAQFGEPFVVGDGMFGPIDVDGAGAPAELGETTQYVDDTAGVALSYPAGWSVIDVDPATKAESTAYAVSFLSWEPDAPGQDGLPEGATKVDLVVVSDTGATSLEEAIAERQAQMAEMDPAEVVFDEERVVLGNGLEAMRWLVESRGEPALVFLTYVDGRVIMVSGLGDLALVEAIGQTLERLP